MEFTYLVQPPKRFTFEMPKLRAWIEAQCVGRGCVLNLFAGKTLLNLPEFRVDLDKESPADWHGDAFEFVQGCTKSFDAVILDPPYNIRKAREKYGERWIGQFTKIKNALPRIVVPGGIVITLGYDTVGMSMSRGFRKIGICVICHNGDHNDTLVVVERKL